MPHPGFFQKSLKTVCVDTVLFFALFALVGHLTINFWERYTIQNELSTMKHSLHTLKDTITNIGKAYDNLHTELKDLFSIVDKNQNVKVLIPQCMHQKEPDQTRCKNKYDLDHKKLHDFQVQTVITKPHKVGVGVLTDARHYKEPHGHEHKATGPTAKNASTITKNPPKSTGITSDMSDYEKELKYHNHLRCYKDFEHCRHVCHHAHTQK